MLCIQLYEEGPVILQLGMRRGRDPRRRAAQTEAAELELKPLLPDSRSLAPDASPSESSEDPVMGPQPGQGTVSHPTCPLRIKIKCEPVKEVEGVEGGSAGKAGGF